MASSTARDRFLAEWTVLYPETPPITYLFKHRLRPRWVRIHSLPNSKRYAENEEEWEILLSRQNELIGSLVKPGTPICIVFDYLDSEDALFASLPLDHIGTFADDGREYGDEMEHDCHQLETVWQPSSLDPLLRRIANDELRAFIMAPGCLISPYDGGVDVVLREPHLCGEFRRRFKDWLSSHPEGY